MAGDCCGCWCGSAPSTGGDEGVDDSSLLRWCVIPSTLEDEMVVVALPPYPLVNEPPISDVSPSEEETDDLASRWGVCGDGRYRSGRGEEGFDPFCSHESQYRGASLSALLIVVLDELQFTFI